MSPRFVLGRENVPCVAEVVKRSLKADCTDFKSLETGLRDEALVTNLRPTLQGTEVSDQSLMRIVNDPALKQAERKLKMASAAGQQRTLKVNLAQRQRRQIVQLLNVNQKPIQISQ